MCLAASACFYSLSIFASFRLMLLALKCHRERQHAFLQQQIKADQDNQPGTQITLVTWSRKRICHLGFAFLIGILQFVYLSRTLADFFKVVISVHLSNMNWNTNQTVLTFYSPQGLHIILNIIYLCVASLLFKLQFQNFFEFLFFRTERATISMSDWVTMEWLHFEEIVELMCLSGRSSKIVTK